MEVLIDDDCGENVRSIIDELYENVDAQEICFSDNPTLDNTVMENHMDLDLSWMEEQSRLNKINENYVREPMESIDLFFIYINRNLYIEKILYDKQALELSHDKSISVIKKETLLHIIQSRKIKTPFSKYKLLDVLSYTVDLEPENIQSYSKNENFDAIGSSFFKVLPIVDDIKIGPSIFVFHGINAIYFLFQEVENGGRHTLKSILKTSLSNKEKDEGGVGAGGSTKKVRIQLTAVERPHKTNRNNRGTRKEKRI